MTRIREIESVIYVLSRKIAETDLEFLALSTNQVTEMIKYCEEYNSLINNKEKNPTP